MLNSNLRGILIESDLSDYVMRCMPGESYSTGGIVVYSSDDLSERLRDEAQWRPWSDDFESFLLPIGSTMNGNEIVASLLDGEILHYNYATFCLEGWIEAWNPTLKTNQGFKLTSHNVLAGCPLVAENIHAFFEMLGDGRLFERLNELDGRGFIDIWPRLAPEL